MTKMYTAEVVADSISPEGCRITSIKVIYPHAVHKDMLRHRCMNRNVESFRAQPPEKLIEALRNGAAFKPDVFGHRTKGMGQRNEPLEGQDAIDQRSANLIWDLHVERSLQHAEAFLELGIAKQQVNFVLQDLCPLTEIITATDWSNFAALRTELNDDGTPVARPEVYKTAHAIMEAIDESLPVNFQYDEIHLPFVTREERERGFTDKYLISISAGRCARISYGDFDWRSELPEDSVARSKRLLEKGHMSPYEQQAKPFSKTRWALVDRMKGVITASWQSIPKHERDDILRQLEYSGNLHGWVPARKMLPNEWDYSLVKAAMLAG